MSAAAPLIELEDVTVSLEDRAEAILTEVTWRIAPGEFWAVAGELSYGRTSLLETAAGLTPAGAGAVRVFGHAVEQATETDHFGWRQRIGFVFEMGGGLLSGLTIAENIALPLVYHGLLSVADARERALALLESVGLRGEANLLPSRLAATQQQRVAYLRAIATPKEIVFLDHPRGEHWWARALGELQRAQAAASQPVALAVTVADFRVWQRVADRFAVIEDGVFRVLGAREQLLASEAGFVRELL